MMDKERIEEIRDIIIPNCRKTGIEPDELLSALPRLAAELMEILELEKKEEQKYLGQFANNVDVYREILGEEE